MISRLLEVRSSLCCVLQELKWDDLAVSQWKLLDSIQDLLQPFATFTSLKIVGQKKKVNTFQFTTDLASLCTIQCHLQNFIITESQFQERKKGGSASSLLEKGGFG